MDDNNSILQDQNEAFRWDNQLHSGDQLELAWLRISGSPPSAVGFAPERPRTLSCTGCPGSFQSSDDAHPLMYTRSAGPSLQPSRTPRLPRSPSNGAYSTLPNLDHRNAPVYSSTPASQPGRKRRREPQPKRVEVRAYDPAEFVAFSDPAVQRELLANDIPNYHDQTRLFIDTDPMLNWSLSDDPSAPSTPATALTETSTLSSQMMSRNGSIASYHSVNNSLTQDFNMLRVNSNFSFTEEGSGATDFNQEDMILYCQSDPKFFVTHQDPSATSSFNFLSNEFSSHLSASSDSTLLMKRLSSTQSLDSDSSTSQSRSSRRNQEQIRQAINCPIAPKVDSSDKLSTAPRMVRVRSEDGSMQVKAAIARKAAYQRPHHPKLFCELCNDHPDGFRGEHELQRHMNRAHSKIRKVWICEDLQGDGKWLENCKACRTQKRYGAYYNAAAHLRRAHFNPRKRGRKAKTEGEKRGGKGGGNWPAMEYLKERWMREVEEVVYDDSPPVDFSSNDEAAAADAEDKLQQGEQEVLVVSTAEEQQQQQQQPCPSSVNLSPDAHCSSNDNLWPEPLLQLTDCLTSVPHDFATDISPTSCYSFDSQHSFPSPEIESFVNSDEFQTQYATSYPDHFFEDWSQ